MVHNENWNDLKFVLAVAEAGSVSAAAKGLGVNHATVLRHISAFETRHAMRVFQKSPQGYVVLPDRRALIETMREAGAAVQAVDRLIDATRPTPGTALRITSTDTFCQFVLPVIAADMYDDTGITIELQAANTHSDLSRLDADITIRPAPALPPELKGELAGQLSISVYGHPQCPENAWLGLSGPLSRSGPAKWVRERTAAFGTVATADSFLTLASLAAAGLGRTALPDIVGVQNEKLSWLERDIDLTSVPIWVACHADLAGASRLRRARSYLCEALDAKRDILDVQF